MSTTNRGFVLPLPSLAASGRLPYPLVAGTFRCAFVRLTGFYCIASGQFFFWEGGAVGVVSSGILCPTFPPPRPSSSEHLAKQVGIRAG